MGKAGNDDMSVVARGDVGVQGTTAENIMSRKRYEQRVLDVVVESVAISNALEGDASGRWHYLHEVRLRRSEPATHIGAEKFLQGICRQFR